MCATRPGGGTDGARRIPRRRRCRGNGQRHHRRPDALDGPRHAGLAQHPDGRFCPLAPSRRSTSMLADYRQVYDPLGNSLGLSSIVAALPLVTLFVLLGVLRMRAWLASVIGLAGALIVAVAADSRAVGGARTE